MYSQLSSFINLSLNVCPGFGFAIKRMSANVSTDGDLTPEKNPYAQDYIGVEKFLDIISLEKTTEDNRFCLSHVFTYRDFEDGFLGLAWVGEAGKHWRYR